MFGDMTEEQLTQFLAHSDTDLVDTTQNGYYIGIMSGTSLDALDLVLCRFLRAVDDEDESEEVLSDNILKIELTATHTAQFDDELRAVLLALCSPDGVNALGELPNYPASLSELEYFGKASTHYADLCAVAVDELLKKANVDAESILAIGVHGQTVRHRPEYAFSLQLIDPNRLAEQTGIATVSDFRRRDMAVGGQGAPLVPAFHQAIFGQFAPCVVLNLGGIANITVLGDTVLGYDTGVANLLMDGFIKRHLDKPYDEHGNWAKSGVVNEALLAELLKHPFLAQVAPKSAGREQFNLDWLDGVLKDFEVLPQDVQATLCEFTAKTVADELIKHDTKWLFVCGGGAYNTHLLSRIQYYLPACEIQNTETVGLSPTWVEATCFAWLARQKLLGQTANLPAVTGASRPVVLGQVCF